MKSIEVSAKKREDAIEKGLKALGIERHEAHVEIVDEGSPGFLGIGARDVVVRVSLEGYENEFEPDNIGNRIVDEPARKDTGKRGLFGRGRSRDAAPQRSATTPQQRGPAPQQRGSAPQRGPAPQRGQAQQRAGSSQRGESQQRGGAPQRGAAPQRGQAQQRGGAPQRRGGAPERPAAAPEQPSAPAVQKAPEAPRVPAEPIKYHDEARGSQAAALLHEVIQNMGIEATVTPEATETGGLKLQVASPDSALLIGRKGRNLVAMQYLINRMINNSEESKDSERIVVDVEGYHDRRKVTLEEMALRLAKRAKETGRRVRVKPLPPQERRVIHVALQDDPDVRTFSVGDAALRSVVIAPKNETEEETPRRERGGRGTRSERGPRPERGGRPRGGHRGGPRRPRPRSEDDASARSDAEVVATASARDDAPSGESEES